MGNSVEIKATKFTTNADATNQGKIPDMLERGRGKSEKYL